MEQGIVGREIECAVLQGRGTDAPRVSHVGEIEVTAEGGHEFYDFEAKYLDDGAVLSCPANVPAVCLRGGAAAGGRGVRGARAAKGWRGWTASTPTPAT